MSYRALFTLSLVLVEVPSNLLVKRYGSRVWLSVLIGGCGMCTIGQAFVPSWRALVGLRTFLGLFEGTSILPSLMGQPLLPVVPSALPPPRERPAPC